MTILEILKSLDIPIKTKGNYITKIGDIGEDGKIFYYWQFYIDNKISMIPIDKFLVNPSAKLIELKYEIPPEGIERQKILLTGSEGFIGRNLYPKLSSHYLVRYDLVLGNNITDSRKLEMFSKGCNAIIHLAGKVLVDESIRKPLEYFDDLKGTLNILEVARKFDIPKILYASSAAVYNLQSPYGLVKLQGEEWMKMYSELYGIKTLSMRFFNIYGPFNNKGIIYHFIKAAKEKESLIVYGDGNQIRDYVHVNDVTDFISSILNDNFECETVDIGTGVGSSVNDIINILKILSKQEIKTINRKAKFNDSDYSVAQLFWKFKPKINLFDGIKGLL